LTISASRSAAVPRPAGFFAPISAAQPGDVTARRCAALSFLNPFAEQRLTRHYFARQQSEGGRERAPKCFILLSLLGTTIPKKSRANLRRKQ
jgi:hypothetical protein